MPAMHNNKTKYIRIAAIITLVGNAILSTLKITIGIISNSSALIGSGIDSSTDVLIGIITLIVAKIITKPADKGHPWGHGRAETVTTILLSFIIFFAGAQLIFSSISSLVVGREEIESSAIALIVTGISIVGKSLLAWSQHILGKRADSQMIKANAKNMASDIIISIGVMVGLLISTLIGWAYADSIIAILIGAWIIKTAVGIFLETNLELMDGNRDLEAYRIIAEAVNAVEGASNPHRARARRVAGLWDIDLDIDVSPKITVEEAHIIASKVEKEIKSRLTNVFDIMIHIEPLGNKDKEMYGLSEEEMIEDRPLRKEQQEKER